MNPCALSLYLRIPLRSSLRKQLAKLRLSSHTLAIETGRWHTPQSIPKENRVCKICNDGNSVEDEYHFVMICPVYEDLRRQYIPGKYLDERTQEQFIK